ncbi:hypothetical protein ABIE82_006884 [Bradyrhizobium diazoefficiens]
MVLRDHRQREVDARRDACRRPHIAVAGKDLVRLELHLGIARDEIARAAPMRGGAASVEQTRFGEYIGARADAGDPNAAPSQPLHEGTRDLAARGIRHTRTARDDECRDGVRRFEITRHHLDARGAAHRPRIHRQHPQRKRLAGAACCDLEHRDRARRIEQLEIREDQNADHGYVRN